MFGNSCTCLSWLVCDGRVFYSSEETGSLLLVLSQCQFESEAKELQESFTALLQTIQRHYKEIWPPDNQLVEHSNSSIVSRAI